MHFFNYQPPPQDSWKCRRAVYVLKYQNDSSSGQIDIEPTASNQYEFTSQPGRKWSIEMKTQAVNDNGEKGESSDWSNAQTISTPGLPGSLMRFNFLMPRHSAIPLCFRSNRP